MSYIADLKSRVLDLEEENDHLQSLIDCFFTGNIPNRAGPEHFIIAKYGRKRLEELKDQQNIPALLRAE